MRCLLGKCYCSIYKDKVSTKDLLENPHTKDPRPRTTQFRTVVVQCHGERWTAEFVCVQSKSRTKHLEMKPSEQRYQCNHAAPILECGQDTNNKSMEHSCRNKILCQPLQRFSNMGNIIDLNLLCIYSVQPT